MAALWFAKDLTEDNAKEKLHSTVPNFKKLGYDSVFNIYWKRRGVQGVGVGVKSVSEGKDFALFGYKAECESWIYAMAAALKAAEILASLLKLIPPKDSMHVTHTHIYHIYVQFLYMIQLETSI